MKRTLFITIGGIALLAIFVFWIYLLLFGTPRSVEEVVGDFGFGNITATPITPADTTMEGDRQLDLTEGTLYQLTTKPVAGFGFVEITEGRNEILYAERGTGHVYHIDIDTGVETRLLQKSFVAINRAYFAPNGSAVVLVGETESGTVARLEELDQTKTPHVFPAEAENIAFTAEREVRYTTTSSAGTTGYSYNLDSAETDTIFSTGLSDIRVIWTESGPLVYSRTAPGLSGSLYRANSNILSAAGGSGASFSAMAHPNFAEEVVETYLNTDNGRLISRMGSIDIAITTIPDKCVFDPIASDILWCGAPLNFLSPQQQSDWYKGLTAFSDLLWEVDLNDGSAKVAADLFSLASREIDVLDLTIDSSSNFLLFKNKNDDGLWLKRLSNPTTNEDLLNDSEEVADSEI